MSSKKLATLTHIQPVAVMKQEPEQFYNLPTSSASNLIMEVLGSGAAIDELPHRKHIISHSSQLQVLEKGNRRQIKLEQPKASVTVELSDIDKLAGHNRPAKKLFVLCMIKANMQAVFNGQLGKKYISFPLQELVDIGFYKSTDSARRGFKDGMDTLTSIKVKGQDRSRGKKKESHVDFLRVPFIGYDISRGQCVVQLNEDIDWSFLAQYFTILPQYYFKLPNRSSELLLYIFYLARQNTKEIKERGYFNISFRAIQARLNLPSEVNNREPQKTIRQPIEEAIENIETEHSSMYHNTEFALLPVYDEAAPITEYLDNGYLRVTLSGNFSTGFISMSEKQVQQIQSHRKRQEKIVDTAIAKNMAKHLQAGNE